jgi:hypothetical protein
MSRDPINPLKTEGLQIIPQSGDDSMRVVMSGAVEMRDPGDVLNPYWNAIDEQARERSLRRVDLDVRDVSFMNSSGILTLVRWITKLKGLQLKGENVYQLVLEYDRNVTWQRTSIPTLAKLAPAAVITSEINGN